MVFTTEGLLEVAIESWPEYIYIYIYIYETQNLGGNVTDLKTNDIMRKL